jgi:hypothetical protein
MPRAGRYSLNRLLYRDVILPQTPVGKLLVIAARRMHLSDALQQDDNMTLT